MYEGDQLQWGRGQCDGHTADTCVLHSVQRHPALPRSPHSPRVRGKSINEFQWDEAAAPGRHSGLAGANFLASNIYTSL